MGWERRKRDDYNRAQRGQELAKQPEKKRGGGTELDLNLKLLLVELTPCLWERQAEGITRIKARPNKGQFIFQESQTVSEE